MVLYKEDLDDMVCAGGHGSKDLWLHSACHIETPTWAKYGGGVLRIRCANCGRVVAEIAVQKRP